MVHRYGCPAAGSALPAALAAPGLVDAALGDFDLRRAVAAVWEVVAEGNRYVERVRPWELARAGDAAGLDAALGTLLASCRVLGELLAPFLPDAVARIAAQLAVGPDGRLPAPLPLFPRL
jgi:methionyl-tRNA synthetase